jgi:hypothetical protein
MVSVSSSGDGDQLKLDHFKYMSCKNSYGDKGFNTKVTPAITMENDAICSNGFMTATAWKDPSTIVCLKNENFKKFEAH